MGCARVWRNRIELISTGIWVKRNLPISVSCIIARVKRRYLHNVDDDDDLTYTSLCVSRSDIMWEWKRWRDGQQKKSRELEKKQESAGLQYGRHSGLYRAGSIPTNRLWTGLRLLVPRSYYVRDAYRYDAFSIFRF